MKVVIAELEARSHYVSREFAFTIGGLIETHGWRHLELLPLWEDPAPLGDQLRARLGELPEVILFWEGYELIFTHLADLVDLDCLKVVFADDLHCFDEDSWLQKRLSYQVCDLILTAYADVFPEFYPELAPDKPVVWVPHGASPDFLMPFNPRAENAVVLSGAIDHHYPLRQRMLELATDPALGIVHHPHPGYHCGYDHTRDAAVGPGYARLLNRHRAGFTDGPFRYLVAKHFEIPATGCLLLAEQAMVGGLQKLGLREGVHFLATSAEDLEDRLAHLRDERHHRDLDAIRRRGQAAVRRRHTTRHRAALIDRVCARAGTAG